MTLVRPGLHQAMEQTVELTLEQRIFGELEGIKESQTFIRVVLLGGDYRDIRHEGKLPLLDKQIALLEGKIDLQKDRIKLLEEDKLGRDVTLKTAVGTAKLFSGWIGAGVGAVAGACASALLHVFLHH